MDKYSREFFPSIKMKIKYIGQINKDGVSEYLNKKGTTRIFDNDANDIKEKVDLYLPERQKVHHKHPEWLKDNIIDVLKETEISVTFITEGAGYMNSIGYFIYETKTPPFSVLDISCAYIIYANCSLVSSGGSLVSGDTMQLAYFTADEAKTNEKYLTPSNYKFPVGYSVGFLLFPNGWNGKNTSESIRPYCSISKYNPESAQELKYHTVCLRLPDRDTLIMGFEDLDRESSSCDNDFNDCVLSINTNLTAVSKKYVVFEDEDDDDHEDDENNKAPVSNYTIAYKKILSNIDGKTVECVATIYIPSSSKIIRKKTARNRFKTDRAYIKSIITVNPKSNLNSNDYVGYSLTTGHSMYKSDFIYEVGKYVVADIDEETWTGIYFFNTFQEASEYIF